MKLVIVESPTKAKTISNYLKNNYKVESSFGHVRDLPKSELGIDVENNFQPRYVIPVKSKKIISHLKKIAQKSSEVILATDEDREGEAIAWHLIQVLGIDSKNKPLAKRIAFHEITKEAIEKALSQPRDIDMNLVDAQQARRILDRLVGYKLSPFLWKKVARRLSAGRVQSVAIRLIVEREEEIKNFKPEEFWKISAVLSFQAKQNNKFEATLFKIKDKAIDKLAIKNKQQAQQIVSDLERSAYKVLKITHKKTQRHPLPPFTTSTFQQTAANRLGYSAKKTMAIAQQLYEKGYITYMRTDSVQLSQQSITAAQQWLMKNLGKQYALSSPRQFKTKSKSAQEAHEAIRPTYVGNTPEKIKIESSQKPLYELIWRRFIASQMPSAQFSSVSIEVAADPDNEISSPKYILKATGQQLLFDGFLKIWPQKIEDKILPILQEGDDLKLRKINSSQHFTEPPPRYNEASLVKTLEEKGIGRPSTYASIISVIQERGYVAKEKGKFVPTLIGETVNKILVKHFPQIVDINFTAKMEGDLDKIAQGKEKWQKIINEFYQPFIKNLEEKYQTVDKVKKPDPIEINEICEKCGRKMVIRQGRFGKFKACSGFPKCKNTKRIKDVQPKILATGINCPQCHEGELVQRFAAKRRRIFWGCSRYPKCQYATWQKPENIK